MKRLILNCSVILALVSSNFTFSQSYVEGFDNVAALTAPNWVQVNNSNSPNGTYFQGNPTVFNSNSGATNSYLAVNWNSTSSLFFATISNWLITPARVLRNGDEYTFYTRANGGFPDRLQVRLSTAGQSTNVGTTTTSVGDFTTLLADINPTLTLAGYPTTWTQYTVTISGLSQPIIGRLAFRYFVTDAGSLGSNGDFIGIDDFTFTSTHTCPTVTMTAGGALTGGVAGQLYSETIEQNELVFLPTFTITGGALPAGLTLNTDGTITGTPTETGVFNFTVTVEDFESCSGSEDYSIEIECPTITMTAGGALSNGVAGETYSGAITHVETLYNPVFTVTSGDLPDGLTLNADGTITGTPTETGVFTFTVTILDDNLCTANEDYSIEIECPANPISFDAFPTLCDSDDAYTLVEGLPTGGTYSGVGVTAGVFDPSQGTQDITYTYIDEYDCEFFSTSSISVNAGPAVTLNLDVTTICNTASPFTLTGGSPEGGVYSGSGVSGSNFNPATAGASSIITYTVEDGNGCSGSATGTITVQNCVGIGSNELYQLSIYPNPSSGIYTVQLNGEDVITDVVVVDMQGRVVQHIGAINMPHATIDITNEPNGVYFLKSTVNQHVVNVKLEKLN